MGGMFGRRRGSGPHGAPGQLPEVEPLAAAAQEFEIRGTVRIRAAQSSDLSKLEWFGAYSHFRDLYQRTWSDHLAGRRLMLVADLHGFPIGQVWLDVVPAEFAYLYALRVMEPFQGMGVGTRLVQSAEELARSHHYHHIQLAVERSNTGARRLYERLGFQIFTQRVDAWSYTDHHGQVHWVQEDVFVLRKQL
jgi:ribosomal protein S18 acetylase RimI-like enzyme